MSYRQNIDERLPVARGRKMWGGLNGYRAAVGDDEKFWKWMW